LCCHIQLTPTNRSWPEDQGGILVKKGAYDHMRQIYEEERRKEFLEQNKRFREVKQGLTNYVPAFNSYNNSYTRLAGVLAM